MSFLNPAILWGLTAIAAPILIHLLNRRRYEKVVWAAMRFLQAAVQQNRRRLRVEDLLLLIMRCALVALLAFALARPTVHAAAGLLGGGAVTAVVIVDNSFSMSGTDGVSSRFENARKAATQLIDGLPIGSSVAVLLASDIAEPVIAEPTLDVALAKASVAQARLSDRSTSLLPSFRQAVDILKRKASGTKELYLITDGQRSGWSALADIRTLLDDARDQLGARVVLIGPEVTQNLAVTDLRMASGLSPADRSLRFETAVSNFGSIEAKQVHVQLKIDAKPGNSAGMTDAGSDAAVDEATIDSLAAGTTRMVSLFGKLRGPGPHAVTASLPTDRLPADDSRTIVCLGLSAVKVLLVDGESGSTTAKSGAFFLRNALLPIAMDEIERYFIRVTTIPASALGSQRLDGFDAVIFANVLQVDGALAKLLADYVERGGGLIIFPGSNVDPANYNRELLERTNLLPASLGTARGEAGQAKVFTTWQAKNFEHPIAAIWNDPASGNPAAAQFYRYFTLNPVEAKTGEATRVVLRYADGLPAVMERPIGFGRVVLFSSSADSSWCDLPVRPGLFVPLIYRTVGSIISRQDEALNVFAGQPFSYRASPELMGRDVTITSPANTKDAMRVELSGGNAMIQDGNTSLAGAYNVHVSAPEPLDLKFAVLRDKTESRLETLSDADRRLLSQSAQIVQWQSDTPLDQAIRTARAGRELWTMLAIAVVLLLAVETFLGNWFSRPK